MAMGVSEQRGGQSDERTLLTGFLDWYRAIVEHKVQDLSLDDAARVMTPSGLSPLGIVAHLASVEIIWFEKVFGASKSFSGWKDHGQFQLRADDSVESVVAEYRAACARSQAVVEAAASLDALSASTDMPWGIVSLRWILVHMIEETARHVGHLDLMREQIDGRTGD
jgi:uncharacterized damage-inducible protein DinB